MKRSAILIALVAIVALPFLLRPKQRPPEKADDTLIVITPHNEAIRHEFEIGFREWYHARTGRSVALDWRNVGGTSDITRFLDAAFVAAFRNHWTNELHRDWSAQVEAGFANPRLAADAPAEARAARAEFLASKVGCGIDVFFGGGAYDFERHAEAGRLVPMRTMHEHPEWFRDEVIPMRFEGEPFWDPGRRWAGNVLAGYGILYNRDALGRLGLAPPREWRDLCDPRYLGEIAVADPTKSGSIAVVFEYIVQQQMQRRLGELTMGGKAGAEGAERQGETTAAAAPRPHRAPGIEAKAVRDGWVAGLRLIQLIGANARYFTDSSQKPPIDVAQGDCAAGLCIDFYGRSQAEATAEREAGGMRLGFVAPRGGSANSVDPIGILRGAPHRDVAEAFVEFTLTMDGQKLLNFRPGTPGGPVRFALRRLPVRRDFYARTDWRKWRSDPDANPYGESDQLVYRPEWTESLYRELAFITRVMALDTHPELARAWRAINAAPEPARTRALAALQDMDAVNYDRARAEITRVLTSKNKVDEVVLARELAGWFRRNYERAEELAEAPP
ncbi:MAG TPA: extracellular solute-binding protein [Opitutus sp.]|nr:extracellular solute-binding protein [Opitutus sp.]